MLSSAFVRGENYGTRCSTIVTTDRGRGYNLRGMDLGCDRIARGDDAISFSDQLKMVREALAIG